MVVHSDAHGQTGNRRDLLVRVGSWMKHSWRRSRESLTDNDNDACDTNNRRGRHRRWSDADDGENEDGDDENDRFFAPKKHVRFNRDEGQDEELMVTIIPSSEDESMMSEDDMKERWFQDYDYVRFEKDRVLTSFSYNAATQQRWNANNSNLSSLCFDENQHSIRGIEQLCDKALSQRIAAERKDLYRAIAAEAVRQKEDRIYPDLDSFQRVSIKQSKAGKERALSLAQEDAQCEQKMKSSNYNLRRIHSAMNPFYR